MNTSLTAASATVIAEQNGSQQNDETCSLHASAACHVVPDTDRLSLCAALTVASGTERSGSFYEFLANGLDGPWRPSDAPNYSRKWTRRTPLRNLGGPSALDVTLWEAAARRTALDLEADGHRGPTRVPPLALVEMVREGRR